MKNKKTPLILLSFIVIVLAGTFGIVHHDMKRLPQFKVEVTKDSYQLARDMLINVDLNSSNTTLPVYERAMIKSGQTIYPDYVGNNLGIDESPNYPKPFLEALKAHSRPLRDLIPYVQRTPQTISLTYTTWQDHPQLVVVKYDVETKELINQTLDLSLNDIQVDPSDFGYTSISSFETDNEVFFIVSYVEVEQLIQTKKEGSTLHVEAIKNLPMKDNQYLASDNTWQHLDTENAEVLLVESHADKDGESNSYLTLSLKSLQMSDPIQVASEDEMVYQVGSTIYRVNYQTNRLDRYPIDAVDQLNQATIEPIWTTQLASDENGNNLYQFYFDTNTLSTVEEIDSNQKVYQWIDLTTGDVYLQYTIINTQPHRILDQWDTYTNYFYF